LVWAVVKVVCISSGLGGPLKIEAWDCCKLPSGTRSPAPKEVGFSLFFWLLKSPIFVHNTIVYSAVILTANFNDCAFTFIMTGFDQVGLKLQQGWLKSEQSITSHFHHLGVVSASSFLQCTGIVDWVT